jgi:hypothetical protein
MIQLASVGRLVGRATVGAIAGVLIAFIGTVVAMILLRSDPVGSRVLGIAAAFGAGVGSTLAIVAGKAKLGEKAKNVTVGVLAGALVGFVAALISGHVMGGPNGFYALLYVDPSQAELLGQNLADRGYKTIQAYQFEAGLVTIPVGCLIGGMLGYVAFKTRHPETPRDERYETGKP